MNSRKLGQTAIGFKVQRKYSTGYFLRFSPVDNPLEDPVDILGANMWTALSHNSRTAQRTSWPQGNSFNNSTLNPVFPISTGYYSYS